MRLYVIKSVNIYSHVPLPLHYGYHDYQPFFVISINDGFIVIDDNTTMIITNVLIILIISVKSDAIVISCGQFITKMHIVSQMYINVLLNLRENNSYCFQFLVL